VHPLVVEDLTKRFGRTTAVDRLSFAVPAGSVCGFLGPNGAGKTTTLRIVLGWRGRAPAPRTRSGA
jgi:ABC-2 type transport system ATP-binding protein